MRIGVITLTLAFSMALAFLVVGAFAPESGAGPCIDTDLDTICVDDDNCSAKANTPQHDTDGLAGSDAVGDGYGNACDADYDGTLIVGAGDLVQLRAAWQCTSSDACYNRDVDSDSNDAIGAADLVLLRSQWQSVPGPSGMSCAGTTPCQ
jgi:hypothetical protein